MSLAQEIELNRDFVSSDEELLLALLHTHQLMEQVSALLLSRYELTPTQFNALMIVRDYEKVGIRQTELARRLLINRASAGTLVDNLCSRNLMVRRSVPQDRRAHHLALTGKSRRLLARATVPYYQRIERLLANVSASDKKRVCKVLATLRARLREHSEELGALPR